MNKQKQKKYKRNQKMGFMIFLMVFSLSAQASMTGDYPWESTLSTIMTSLSGPVAYSFAGIAIVISGLSMAFLDLQGGAKKGLQACVGISIAFGAATLLSSPLFNFAGAVIR